MKTALIARQLTHKFSHKVALNNIDLSISSSGVTALLGANGAGKTTLINCALGLCKPSSGEITLFGQTPGKLETKQLIGVMLQDSNLPDLLTAREQIELFSSYYHKSLSIDEVADRCDLGEFLNKKYKKLSGGQKRRVQFALAIVGQPRIVFLDEPTTGLDIDARKIVWKTISELSNAGTAVVLCTHYLEEAESLADHTIVMNHGNIIANDSTENIRAKASGAVIRCETRLDMQAISKLSQVRSVEKIGRNIEIGTRNATTSLIELLALDPKISNLSVYKSSLEDAFVQLNQLGIATKVMIVTTFARPGYLERARAVGVLGYVLKDAPSESLATSLRKVFAGQLVIEQGLAEAAWASPDPLNNRERDILRLAEQGKTNKEIGQQLHLSAGTIRNYLADATQKLGASNRIEASRIARDNGWL